jgi:NAD(P)-dependent dehydrogenase (short-subunit alcohol dehydrogenase family)
LADFSVDLSGHVACVTGASSGIGRHLATVLTGAGAKVVGVARREDQLKHWQVETKGETAIVVADLTDRDARVSEPFGAPDILLNGAGINTRQAADDVTPEGWDTTLDLNLRTPFFLAQGLAPAMKKKGWGRIINIASLQTYRAFPGGISYGASKAGVAQMTRAMAEAWSRHGITANAIGPGFVHTPLTGPVFADEAKATANAAQTCIGRNSTVEDLAGPCLFLCSDASAYVTGHVLMVDGGFTAK